MALVQILVGLIVGVATFIYVFFKWRYSYWKKRGIPHFEPSFPYGNLVSITDTISLNRRVCELYNRYKDKTPFVGYYFFSSPNAVITDNELVKNMLIKDFKSFQNRGLYCNENIDPLSGHLFLLEGQKWKTLRAKLSPTFTSGKMKFMFPTVVEIGERFVDTLRELVSEEDSIEMKEVIKRFTTDVIGTTAFGIECNSLKDPNTEFRTYGRKVFGEPPGGPFGFLLRSQLPRLASLLKLKNTADDVEKFFLNVVYDTVEYREKNNVKRNDFMDLLIQLKNTGQLDDTPNQFIGKLSLKEVAAQAFVFFVAGFETSGTVMSFCLFELAMNPDIQTKVREEVNRVLESYSGNLTYEAMLEMTYLEQVINETLRKYPTLIFLFRKANEDYKVPNSDKVIEKGTRVIIPIYAIHHDKDTYPNPDVFDPERFSPEQVKLRKSQTFLPFGDGPRNCIGMRFGQMQTRIGIISILKNFNIKLSPKLELPLKISYDNLLSTIQGGLWMKLKKL